MMPTLLPAVEPQTVLADETDFTAISNDDFLTAIFGTTFDVERPLVCCIAGDPENKGWLPQAWPCDTSNAGLNRYVAPAVFVPNEQGRYRAQKRLGRGVYAVMLDDIGSKVPAARLAACPPSW